MEVPFNTEASRRTPASTADVSRRRSRAWDQKRAWVDYAFRQFEAHGYVVCSAYTLVKPERHAGFVYRDSLVARGGPGRHRRGVVRALPGRALPEPGHVGGVHRRASTRGELPINRALPVNDHQRLIREMILQLKTGKLDAAYFRKKFGVGDRRASSREGLDVAGRARASASVDGDDGPR